MKEVTAWKVYETTNRDGFTQKVLIGYNPQSQSGIVEVVDTVGSREINGYTLVGPNNPHFLEYENLWNSWIAKNEVNSIHDISEQYE